MGYFEDTRLCQEHGFVLTPEGTCLRCVTEGERSDRRRRLAKWVTGATVVVAAVTGISLARARVNPVAEVRSPAPPGVATPLPTPALPAAVTAPDPTPRPSEDWDQAMARAEAQRVQSARVQAAAERQREVAATTLPDPPPVETYPQPRQAQPAGETPDPAFAQSYGRPRTYYRGGARGAAGGSVTNPSAWGLPANNGGYFRNRSGGH